MEDIQSTGFYSCDNDFIDTHLRHLKPAAAAVYQTLCRHCRRDGRCWPGIDRLAELTGQCARTVQLGLAALRQRGLIEVRRQGSGHDRRRAEYFVVPLPLKGQRAAADDDRKAQPDAHIIGAIPDKEGATGCARKAQNDAKIGATDCARSIDRTRPGKGEGTHPPDELPSQSLPEGSPSILARSMAKRFEDLQTVFHGPGKADPADRTAPMFDEWLRAGLPEWLVWRELERADRQRGEYFSAFRARMQRSLASWKANRTRAQKREAPAEVEAPPATKEQFDRLRQSLSGIGNFNPSHDAETVVQ